MSLIAETKYGPVEGFEENGIRRWFGIPFAAPPVGEKRFRRAQAPAPWTEARPCRTMGCSPVQFAAGPMGDLVVLGYLRNDPHSPIVLGSYWNSETTAPVAVKDGKAEDYRLKTPKKVDLSIHDEDKKQKITVTMPSGIVLEIDDEKQTVNTKSKDGKTSLLMKMKDGEVELQASSKITLKAGQASVILEKNGKITVKGSDAVTVQGKSVTAKAQGKTAVQGMDVEVKANKDLNMSATANASLKGMLLKLN